MQTQEVISFSIAVQDYLQIIFTSIGLYCLTRMIFKNNINCGNLSILGGLFIVLGLLFNTTGKLIILLGGTFSPFLNNSLYVLLSAGYISFAWALWKSGRRNEAMTNNAIWGVAIFLTLLVWAIAGYAGIFVGKLAWYPILLQITLFAKLALLLQLIFRSLNAQLWFASLLFIVTLIITVAWHFTDQSIETQTSKITNQTFAQAFFAFASWIVATNEKHLWQKLRAVLKYYLRLLRFILIRQ
jgi:hypothetical protein